MNVIEQAPKVRQLTWEERQVQMDHVVRVLKATEKVPLSKLEQARTNRRSSPPNVRFTI